MKNKIMELKKYKLGDIADIIGGVAYQPSDISNEGVRILRGGNIQSKRIIIYLIIFINNLPSQSAFFV